MPQPRFISMEALVLLLLLLLLFHTNFSICNGLSSVDLKFLRHSSEIDVMTRRVCTKSIGECLASETEMVMMDSESNRRVLEMQKNYISYDVLKRDNVPCDRPGASYYNCHPKDANNYHRGCEVITDCARDVKGIKT